MNWSIIKNGNYEVTDDFVEKVEEQCLEEGIVAMEWEIFCVRFGDFLDTYEDCKDGFLETLQEDLEDYESVWTTLSMTDNEALSLIDGVYQKGYRDFKISSKVDEDVYFYGAINIWDDEEDEDFFSFYDENGFDCGRRFPRNPYHGKQGELYACIINEFIGYSNEIIDFIRDADVCGDDNVFGGIMIHMFEVDCV